MFVGTQCFSLAFYRQKLSFFLESTLNSYYTETNPKLLCAFHTDGSNTGFSSVHRSAVKSEWNAVFFFPFLFSSSFCHPATEILPNMLCSTHLGMQIGKRDMMHKTKRKKTRQEQVWVVRTSTAKNFQPRLAGLDLSGKLSVTSLLRNTC